MDLDAFVIHRAKTAGEASPCKGCPLLFERIGRVPVEIPGNARRGAPVFVFEDRISRGFSYIYKVTVLHKDGRESPDSNHVRIAF